MATGKAPPVTEAFPSLPPEEAIAFFRSKGLAESFAWQDVWQEEHARAFTVAKAMERTVLEEIRAAVDEAISEGVTFDTFKDQLRPKLEDLGWWGRKEMTDPLTGEAREVQLGSSRRLRTIFNMNLRQAYAAGRWERIDQTKALLPFLVFTTVGDNAVRPEHRAWDGVCLPVDDPWWTTHYPPCDWGCRCTTIQVNQRIADRRGLDVGKRPAAFAPKPYTNPRTGEVTTVETGIGPGFNYNVGQAYLRDASPTLIDPRQEVDDALATAPDRQDAIETFLLEMEAVDDDRVMMDPEGYPMVVGPSLFETSAGRPVHLSAEQIDQLPAVADALVQPTSIGWVWIQVAGGRPMLMRRYRSGTMTVDMAPGGGSPSWRFNAR